MCKLHEIDFLEKCFRIWYDCADHVETYCTSYTTPTVNQQNYSI